MSKKSLPSPSTLRKLLRYEPKTGRLFWRARPLRMFKGNVRICNSWNTRFSGKPAFAVVAAKGYLQGKIGEMNLKAHRVAWAVFYGKWPVGQIDHENHLRADNRIRNMRDATHSENQKNRPLQKNNSSGVVGVCLCKKSDKWRSYISSNQSGHMNLGYFKCKTAAIITRKAAEIKHGFHVNHGVK